jgi:hypothetical protein
MPYLAAMPCRKISSWAKITHLVHERFPLDTDVAEEIAAYVEYVDIEAVLGSEAEFTAKEARALTATIDTEAMVAEVAMLEERTNEEEMDEEYDLEDLNDEVNVPATSHEHGSSRILRDHPP